METIIKIKIENKENTNTISFEWELDETNADKTFENIYKEIEKSKNQKNIFDFDKLNYLNSKTIWYLVDIFSTIEEAWWEMFIKNCKWWIKDTLNFTWVDTIIPYI